MQRPMLYTATLIVQAAECFHSDRRSVRSTRSTTEVSMPG